MAEPIPTKVTVQNNIKIIRKRLQTIIDSGIRLLFFWESDDAKIGRLLRSFHQYFIISLIVFYFIVHVFAPSYWYLLFIWCWVTLIGISHLIMGGCVFTRIEHQLTGEKVSIIDPLLELFQIPVTKETTVGITMMASTVCFLFVTSELVTRSILNLNDWIATSNYTLFSGAL